MSNIIKKIIATNENGDQVEAQMDYQSLANLPDKLEYINTVTVTGDSSMIICDKDHNGNDFYLKKVIMYINTKPSEKSTSSSSTLYSCFTFDPSEDLGANTSKRKVHLMSSGLSSSEEKTVGCSAIIDDIREDEDTGTLMAVFHGEPSLSTCIHTNIPAESRGICKIGVYTISTTCFMASGSNIKIYGVRA